jgi:predicted DNA-binding protein
MKRIKSVRFDERTWMLLNELSKKTETTVSVIIRSIVSYSIENLLDKDGNFNFDEEKEE